MFELRQFQQEAIDKLRRSLAGGRRSPVLVSPTGSGKTVMAADMLRSAVDKGGRALFIAPRRELVRQTSRTLEGAGIPHGLLMSGEDPLPAPVQVATWDTLRAWIKSGKIQPPRASVVFVDEAHTSLAPSYRRLIETHYAGTVRVGLTATPARSDGKPLGGLYDDLVEASTVAELTDAGYLVPARYWAPTKPDLEGLRVERGDYVAADIESKFNVPQIVGDVVQQWHRIAPDRQTVVFAATVAHAAHIAERFRESGVAAECIHGKQSVAEREGVLRRVETGETQVIVNCELLVFGWDQPPVSCAVLARPTKSLVRYFQLVGRVLRPSPETGKRDAVVIDHAGVVDELGLVTDPVPWRLGGNERVQDAAKRKRAEQGAGARTCDRCAHVYEGQRTCPKCGFEPPVQPRDLVVRDGDLAELDRSRKRKNREWTWPEKAQFLAELRGYAHTKGYREGWAAHKYREKFGVWPNDPRVKHVRGTQPGAVTLNWIRSRQIAYSKKKGAA